ncbi:MAG: DUF1659 domain-containing protein [Clostridia bacterium]|nr:DUF1659 domain-containing protein [Clostridia bacterium]
MAVTTSAIDANLRIVVQVDTDAEGNPVLRTRSYNRIKPAATDQAVYDAAIALAGLQVYPVNAIHRLNTLLVTAL